MVKNCWEYCKCGREPGGINKDALGVCPATTDELADGYLGGTNGGRACVYITGTYCSGEIQEDYKRKVKNCKMCDFYHSLRHEHDIAMSAYEFAKYKKARGAELGNHR
ncbi:MULTISPECIES: two-CW domain-containing protein [unclassified Fusibacter]|uniref:two-CW domain-containing protein n=1 Tax=unclassified Fusibacter TaxID=2624464 RepID=UPI0010105D1B|nr:MULTISPECIES: hypothetical protein [unclassified Fusibacter]MCK8058513.1 hypothetical protein [Fusibacter sp. A2]NPE22718.1 hypothetical protein [Fusibacter sp. A1]RXV60278.1 hypothetical protein DWB64_12780 [Fusibacter sp. A1]